MADTAKLQGILDQIKELERDRTAGMIGDSEAALAKIEIERRMLAASRTAETVRPVSTRWKAVAIASTTGLIALGAANIYALQGRPDLPSAQTAQVPVAETSGDAQPAQTTGQDASAEAGPGNVDDMIGNLAGRLAKTPDDAEGWRMLGWSYFNRQRFEDAAVAYGKAVEQDPQNLDYKSAYGEALVQAAQGMVVPKAQAVFEEVLKKDSREFRSRFYMALAREQAGDLNSAFDQWASLLADAPKDAGWLVDVRQRLGDIGKQTGRDTSALLATASLPQLGQTTDQNLGAADQQASVAGMIAKLQAKLDANPRDRDGWAMMIRSLKVTGDMEGARAALGKAMAAFNNDPTTRKQLAGLAQSLGVLGAAGSLASSAPQVSADDVATATALPAGDQQAMIRGMVDKLSERLKQNPHDAEGWIRLMRSRMVLNEPELAREALQAALLEFSGDATSSDQISAAARELGVPQL